MTANGVHVSMALVGGNVFWRIQRDSNMGFRCITVHFITCRRSYTKCELAADHETRFQYPSGFFLFRFIYAPVNYISSIKASYKHQRALWRHGALDSSIACYPELVHPVRILFPYQRDMTFTAGTSK